MMTEHDPIHFPIRELVRRTGVNASTLRAWENRHGLLRPLRTPAGHRLYGPADIRRVQRLQELLVQGLTLADIAPLLEQEVDRPEVVEAAVVEIPLPEQTPPAWQRYIQGTLRALEDFSGERLDSLYNETCALHPVDLVTHNLLIPVLEHLGARWDKRASGIAEEHFFASWLRNKLGARLHHGQWLLRSKPLILACLPHENHEIGLLLCALSLLQAGHRVIYLGANMPTRQIAHVTGHSHAIGIVLAGRDVPAASPLLADIAWLVEASDLPVFVGSHFSRRFRGELEHAGAIPLGDDLNQGMRLIEARLAHPPTRVRRPV